MGTIWVRYLTPYNFIICSQFNPINETKKGNKKKMKKQKKKKNNEKKNKNQKNKKKNDSIMKMFMDGILQGTYSINDIVKFVDGLYRHKRDV